MTAEQLLKEGQLDEALKALFQVVRDKPDDAKSRRFLFQLLSVLGDWKRADTQLQVLGEMDSESMMLARIFGTGANIGWGELRGADLDDGRSSAPRRLEGGLAAPRAMNETPFDAR